MGPARPAQRAARCAPLPRAVTSAILEPSGTQQARPAKPVLRNATFALMQLNVLRVRLPIIMIPLLKRATLVQQTALSALVLPFV
jgi:hypothetical protein